MANHPEKLSAVAANQKSFYGGEPTAFQHAHPSVSKLKVMIQEHAQCEKFEAQEYDETDVPAVIDCSNPHCWSGGFYLQPLLDEEMIYHRDGKDKMDFEKSLLCLGHEGTRTKTHRTCRHCFVVKAHIEFKQLS